MNVIPKLILKVLERENTIPPNEEIIRYSICNIEL